MFIGDWRDFAGFSRQLLTLIVLTAEETVVSPEMLEVIQYWADLPDWPIYPDHVDSLTPKEMDELAILIRDAPSVRARMRWETLNAERAQGKALEQQRRIVVQKPNSLFGMQFARFGWDERGRRMESEAVGLDDIVFSHIATIFSSPVDVLICSICGTPYPFEESSSARRPRFGVRRYCRDRCRREGKREANRLSWRRNSSRWRRRTKERTRGGSEG
jgi:hypothetical protein